MTNPIDHTEECIVDFNITAQLRIKKPIGMPNQEAEAVAIEMLTKFLEHPFVSKQVEGMRCELLDPQFWTDTGPVHVGGLGFQVNHDPQAGSSMTELRIRPPADCQGSSSTRAHVATKMTPEAVSLLIFDEDSNQSIEVASISIEDGAPCLQAYDYGQRQVHRFDCGGGMMVN